MDARRNMALTHHRTPIAFAVLLSAALLLSACGGDGAAPGDADGGDTLNVFGAYATQIEEPWDGVIHSALQG